MRKAGDKSLHIRIGGNDMISLDKTIEFYKGYKDRSGGTVNYNEFDEQMVKWLEELKAYIEIGTVEECRNSVLDIPKAYNKAIDDFVAQIENITDQDERLYNIRWDYIAEQLKAGVDNETN